MSGLRLCKNDTHISMAPRPTVVDLNRTAGGPGKAEKLHPELDARYRARQTELRFNPAVNDETLPAETRLEVLQIAAKPPAARSKHEQRILARYEAWSRALGYLDH